MMIENKDLKSDGMLEIIEPFFPELMEKENATVLKKIRSLLLDFLIQNELGEKEIPPYFRESLKEKVPPLSFYIPPSPKNIPPLRQGLNGIIGVVFGLIVIRHLIKLTGLNMEVGTEFFLSSVCGAFLFLYCQNTSPRIKTIEKWLHYCMGIQEGELTDKEIRDSIKEPLSHWANLTRYIIHEEIAKEERKEVFHARDNFTDILPSIYGIYRSSKDELETSLLGLFAQMRSLGFEGLENPSFTNNHTDDYLYWRDDLQDQYNCYGIIEEGDLVRIEKPVIIKNGLILNKGLVRKVRKKKEA